MLLRRVPHERNDPRVAGSKASAPASGGTDARRKGTSIVRRAGRRLLRTAVGLGTPARWVGYRHIARVELEAAAAEVRAFDAGWTRDDPPPANVERVSDLDGRVSVAGFSFRDAPRRVMVPTLAARLDDARVVRTRDRWGNGSFAIVTADDRSAKVPGTGFQPGHLAALREPGAVERIDEAVWILDRSFGNYFHWLVDVLPKTVVVDALGLGGRILAPQECGLQRVVDDSLERLGIDAPRLHRIAANVHAVGRLWVVRAPRFHDGLLRTLRERLVGEGDPDPGRRAYVSRDGAEKRRLANEAELAPRLEAGGLEVVAPERWSFADQIAYFARTELLVSVHGAGLANALFMPPGSDVVEISPAAHPNPVFYALASALGHRYWLVHGIAVEEDGGRHADLRVEPDALLRVLESVEAAAPRSPVADPG